MRRPLLTALSLALAAATSDASAGDVVLSVDADTAIVGTLQSMGETAQDVAVTGTVDARVTLALDPVYGIVASSVEIAGGSFAVADLGWSLDGAYESLETTFIEGGAAASSSPIPATAVSAHTAVIPMTDLAVQVDAGLLVSQGTVTDFDIVVMRDFSGVPWPLALDGVATITTIPAATGGTDVQLSIPLAESVPLKPPFMVTWMRVDGTLSLSGSLPPTPVPASPHPLWVGAGLLAAGWLATRRRTART